MENLIEALQILLKYVDNPDGHYVTCEHDEMYIQVNPSSVSFIDLKRLEFLGFEPSDINNFISTEHGSC